MEDKEESLRKFKISSLCEMTDEQRAMAWKNTLLPHGLGSGQECIFLALKNMTEITSFDDQAHTWVILFLLSNGFEHFLKSLYEYMHTPEIDYDPNTIVQGKPKMIIANHSKERHYLKWHSNRLEQMVKNRADKFELSYEEKAFLKLLEEFQEQKYRFQNININDASEITLERRLKNFVLEFNNHQISNEIIYQTLERNIYTLLAKYVPIIPVSLKYDNDKETPGMDLVKHIARQEKYPLVRKTPFINHPVRTEMTIQDDVNIGKKLFEQGLIGINNMSDLMVTSEGWMNSLLLANGLERILKPVILSNYEPDSEAYSDLHIVFRDVMKHDLLQYHNLIKNNYSLNNPIYVWPAVDEFVDFLSLTIDDEYRYENKDYEKSTPDIEERFPEFAVRHLFADHVDQDLLIGYPALTAYQLQRMVIKLLEFYELNSKDLDLDFKAPLDEPVISRCRIRG